MTSQIFLYGQIGDQAAGLDAKTVTDQVRAARGDLTVFINSPGGFVFEGLPIYEALRGYAGGRVTVQIDGFALSMASLIAMAGSRIVMASTALIMIHRPWDSAYGNAGDMRAEADRLEKIEQQLVKVYADRSGMAEADVAELMAAETWFTAQEALAAGFITEISEPVRAVALADLSAFGFRHPPIITKGNPMSAPSLSPAPPAGAAMSVEQVKEVRALVEAHRLPQSVADGIFRDNMSMSAARAHILGALASASDDAGIGHHPFPGRPGADSFDNPAFFGQSVTDLIFCRMSGKPPEGAARELANMSMVDLAREMLARNGERNAHRMRPADVLAKASWAGPRASRTGGSWIGASVRNDMIPHQTSDFPGLLLDAGQRYLQAMYEAAGSTLKAVSRERSAQNFRAMHAVQLSGFGTLESLPEGAEFRHGTFSERKESFSVATYGKIFGISRQAIVNDDLGAFADMFRVMGRAAAETEAQTLAGLLNSNPEMSDGEDLFSAAHANIVATGGGAPSIEQFDLVRQLMRLQRDMDGETRLNLSPLHVVVPPQLETQAITTSGGSWNVQADMQEFLSGTAQNPFRGFLNVVVEPRLTSSTQWYFFADPLLAPVLEHAYLDGYRGPQIESREAWTSLGMEFRVHLSFGCGVTGWAGAARNSGTA